MLEAARRGEGGEEAREVARILRANGFEVTTLASEMASPAAVAAACKQAVWIHLALPLVGGDPYICDWATHESDESGHNSAGKAGRHHLISLYHNS